MTEVFTFVDASHLVAKANLWKKELPLLTQVLTKKIKNLLYLFKEKFKFKKS